MGHALPRPPLLPVSRWPILVLIVLLHAGLIALSDRLFVRSHPLLQERLSTVTVWLPPLSGIFAIAEAGKPGSESQSPQKRADPVADNTTQTRPAPSQTNPAPAPTSPPNSPGRVAAPQSASTDGVPPEVAAATGTGAATPEGQAPDPARTPLNLTLPRETPGSKRPQALAIEKQIGARASQSLETRIAAAIGPGQWTEELQSPDRIRLRNGNTCVTLERSRIDLIDPFYAKEHPTPWQVGQRTAC